MVAEGCFAGAFFPRADAAIIQSKHLVPAVRPQTVDPIFDYDRLGVPLGPWLDAPQQDAAHSVDLEEHTDTTIPTQPAASNDEYLQPTLTRNERLRLTMLWYFTRDIDQDDDLLSRLEEKVHLAREATGWELCIIGLLDLNTYTRLTTSGVPLLVLPRRESTCAHTVNHKPGSILILPDTAEDWRFRHSPHVKNGGLRAYAGTALRLETEFGDSVALGSLCVASYSVRPSLTVDQQRAMTRIAAWVVSDIVRSGRDRRLRERRRMNELAAKAQQLVTEEAIEEPVMQILSSIYPDCTISVQVPSKSQIIVEGRSAVLLADVEGGLWEDTEFVEEFITSFNHQAFPNDRTLRLVTGKLDGSGDQLVVATQNLRFIFDDIDAWFVSTCASMLCRARQVRQVREALAAKDKFLRGITHQLRTPIHGILGSADLLAEELTSLRWTHPTLNRLTNLTGPVTAQPLVDAVNPFTYVNTIKSSGRELIATVNSIITMNRWEDISQVGRIDSLHSLDGLQTAICDGLARTVTLDQQQSSSIVFIAKYPKSCDKIWIDASLLVDCLLPIVLNAVQNTVRGVITISIAINNSFDELGVDIEDNGCGIPMDQQQRIFEPYEKADVYSLKAGLGLTLSAKFAALLDGRVSLISSSPGLGSHFRIVVKRVAFACSWTPLAATAPDLLHLPRRYFLATQEGQRSYLCSRVANQLHYDGFEPSESSADSLVIIEHIADPTSRAEALNAIASGLVAWYILPSSILNSDRLTLPSHIIPLSGPFVTATLSAALKNADVALSKLQASALPRMRHSDAVEDQHNASEPAHAGDTTSPDRRTKLRGVTIDIPASSGNRDLILSVTSPNPLDGLSSLSFGDLISSHATCLRFTSPRPATLIVDDNNVNLRILKLYCTKRNLQHFSATDGEQAVKSFAKQQALALTNDQPSIELVLMDLQMPVCDGLEATRRMRDLEARHGWRRTVIFIVTGQDSLSDKIDAERAGADGFFVKPVGIKVLDRGVKEWFPAFDPN